MVTHAKFVMAELRCVSIKCGDQCVLCSLVWEMLRWSVLRWTLKERVSSGDACGPALLMKQPD